MILNICAPAIIAGLLFMLFTLGLTDLTMGQILSGAGGCAAGTAVSAGLMALYRKKKKG